jgi:T5SS/PEP-CTERM-associated repeat protein/autotransporter-associated beta strand protein
MVCTSLANAQTTTWTGTTSANWFTGSNWTSGVPNLTKEAIIDTTSFNQTNIKSPGATAKYVVVGNNGTGLLALSAGGNLVTDSDGVGFGIGLYIGLGANSTGSVTLTGSGTSLSAGAGGSHNISVGIDGNGALVVRNGATVNDSFGEIGQGIGAGTVDVSGTGAAWNNQIFLVVGDSGAGSLTVENGGTAIVTNTGNALLIGNGSTGTGTATVTGTGSTLNADNGLSNVLVGNGGAGTLNITKGGTVISSSTLIGYASGSTGTVSVDGAGSILNNASILAVGDQGNGTLTVTKGGTVTTGMDVNNGGLYINFNNNAGPGSDDAGTSTATVDGKGSTIIVNGGSGNTNIGFRGNGSLTISGSGTVIDQNAYVGYGGTSSFVDVTGSGSTWTNNGYIAINTGSVTVEKGGTVTTGTELRVGNDFSNNSGVTQNSGTLTVTGNGSSLTVNGGNGTAYVGYNGNGTLIISNGGTLTDNTAYIGENVGSVGNAVVNGGIWTNNGTVIVGDNSTGTLTIKGGGTVTTGADSSNIGLYIGNNSGAAGAVTVAGTGSTLTVGSNFFGTLIVGNSGTGSLSVTNGGTVTTRVDASNVGLYVGNQANSSGTVTVSGAGSSLVVGGGGVGNLDVGYAGSGLMTVNGGGSVTDYYSSVGGTSTGSGTVDVSGTGSTWTNLNALTVGDAGNGTLIVEKGGVVTTGVDGSNVGLNIANQGNSNGTVTVTGSGTSLTLSGGGGNLVVGNGGNGSLTIGNAGSVSDNNASIGGASTGSGTVDVTGIGSTWTNSKLVTVGDGGSGTLIVEKGGTVTTGVDSNNVGLLLGNQANSTGTVTIAGNGSNLTVGGGGGDVVLGNAGTASLTITNGGSLTDRAAFIGEGSTSSVGVVDVSGLGSSWTNNSTVYLAESGTGTLIVEKNGLVSASDVIIADQSSAVGLLQIGNNNQSGTLTTSSIQFGSGAGTLAFDQTNTMTINAVISGSGTVTQEGSGKTILSGSNTYIGTTFLNAGTLSVSANNNLGDDSGTLAFNGGTLENTASFTSGHAVVLNMTGTFQTDNGTTLILTNTISGTGSLSKTKNGTLILSGSNTYSGGTLLDAGTISVSADNNLGDDSGALTINTGTLVNTASFTSSRAITLNGTGTFQTNADLTLTGSISGAGSLTKTGAFSLILDAANTYSGGTTLADGTLVIGNSNALGTGALTTLDPTVVYTNGVNVANPIIMMGDTTLEVENTDSATQSGTISESGGSYAITKTGSGTLILSGTNTYSGGTTIKSGILTAQSDDALGTGSVTVKKGTTLDIDGPIIVANNVTISGTGTTGQGALTATGTSFASAVTGTVTLAANSTIANYGTNNGFFLGAIQLGNNTLTVGPGLAPDAVFFDGGIAGTGGLNVAGVAVIQLGTNTFTGLTDVQNGGNLYLLDVGTKAITGNLTIEDGGTVTDGTSHQLSDSTVVTMNGTSTLDLSSFYFAAPVDEQFAGLKSTSTAASITTSTGTTAFADSITLVGTGNYSYAGTINDATDTLAIVMAGTGKQTLSGTNTYHGGTFLNAGTLAVSADNNLGAASGTLTFNGGTLESTATFASTRLVTINDTGTFAIDGGTTLTLSNTISGTGSLSKTRNGILVLSGTNTYSGGTAIYAGVIRARSNDALGTGDVTVNADTTLNLGGNITVGNNITISGTGTKGQGAIIGSGHNATPSVSGTVTLAADASVGSRGTNTTLVLGDILLGTNTLTTKGGTVTLVGSISGTGGLNIANVTQIQGGVNSYTGLTDVKTGGSLFLLDAGNLAVPGDLTVEDGGFVDDEAGSQLANTTLLTINGTGAFVLDSTLSGSSVSESIAGLSGTSGSITTVSSTLVQDSISLNGTGSYSFAGIISDSANAPLSLIMSGTGTQTLSGTNTYRGGTIVNSGALVVANPNALGAGDVTVDGGTLSTDGINHTINVGGNYTQGANGTLMLSIFSTTVYDTVTLTGTGTANLNGALKLDIVGSFAPGNGDQFTLISTGNSVTGSFTSVTTNLPSLTGTIDYTNNVTLLFQGSFVNIPELNLNPNQIAVATYIDAHDKFISSPGFAALVGALNSVSGDNATLQGAFNQLMPVNFANFVSSNAFNNASFTTQQLDSYLANHRGPDGSFVSSAGGIDYSGLAVNNPEVDPALQSVRSRLVAWSPAASTGLLSDSSSLVTGGTDTKEIAAPSGAENTWNVFIDGNVILAQDFSNNTASLPYNSTTTGAVQIGADYKLTKHLLVGVTFAYGHTDATLDTIGSNANVNTYSPGVYMSYADNGWYYNALASYGFSKYGQNRNVNIGAFSGTANSAPGGDQFLANLDGGYDFHKGNWTFGPTLGLQYVHLEVDGYSETGLPGADLTVNQDKTNSLRSRLGGEISYAVKRDNLIFTPHLSVSWQHEFMDEGRGITSQFSDVGAGSFVVNTANPSRDSALMDLGLDAQMNDVLTIFSDYSLQAGQSNYFGQSIQAGFKIGF